MIYLSLEQIIELHDALIEKFGGLIGIRERGLLESAVAAPMMAVFGEELHKTIYNKAAAYLFYIAKNHAFLDGNKRTAAAAALAFLRANGKSTK
jgi:death on curing protein